jgi:glycosidase
VYKIDPRFGTNDDYVRLASEIHKKELKLVFDYVTNHWGLEHWMIKDLPTGDWINQSENYVQTNHKRTTINDSNASKIDTETCINGWFVPSMPDLNLTNPLTLKYLIQNAIWWIEYANLDGLRVDTYNYSDPQAMAKWTKSITDEYPHFNIVGEITMFNQAQLSFWQKDSVIGRIQNYNSHLPSVMDFVLSDVLLTVFNDDDDSWGRGMIKIYDNFTNDFLYPNVSSLLIFAENHDTKRLNQVYSNDIRKYKMAMALLATVRGIPQLYYGSEIGMAGDQNLGDADIRQDFPGGWEGDKNNAFTKEGRTKMQNEYFDFTAKLFHWRKTKLVIHSGKMTHYIPDYNIYVYFRYNAAESVMVLLNDSSEIQIVNPLRFKENIGKFKSGKDVLTEQIIDVTSEITLEPKSVLILELE